MDNILELHHDLANHTYKHGKYQAFRISDPKPRIIHKAQVRDRLLHHAIHRLLYPFFDKVFFADSFSCRLHKGTHRAINRFRAFSYKASKNHTKTCWILKGDIKKCFASIHHQILLNILSQYIPDKNILWLLGEVIDSFSSSSKGAGLPLGNLTSQLFANIYLNELDQFVKHKLKLKHYIRYADDFAVFSTNRHFLEQKIKPIERFLENRLRLELHWRKILIKTLASGVDFLGWSHFESHRVLRTNTKSRMIKRIKNNPEPETLNSYLGLLRHGNTHKLRQSVLKEYFLAC